MKFLFFFSYLLITKYFSLKGVPTFSIHKIANALAMISDSERMLEVYLSQIEYQKKEILILSTLFFLSGFVFSIIITKVINKQRREKRQVQMEKEMLQNNLKEKEKKIADLHLNLNLKAEAAKVFLENFKEIKKNKNIDTEEVLQELFLKISNLIQIDNDNIDLIRESSMENRLFIGKITDRFPFLTAQEKKLCVYFRLNLSSRHISLLENITDGSARVYKTKIKSKMNLDKDTDLYLFLNAL